MFFRILKASIKGGRESKTLAFLTIFLAVSLIACMLNLTLSIGDEVAKELRSYGSNIVVLPRSQSLSIEIGGKEYSPLKNEDYLAQSEIHKIKEIFWRNNITAFAPFLSVRAGGYEVVGTYFDKVVDVKDEPGFSTGVKTLYPFWGVEGKWPKEDSLDEVIAGSNLKLSIGDKLNLNGLEARVVGILSGAENEANKLVSSLKLAQTLAGKEGLVAKVEVGAMTIPENDLSVKARRNLDNLDSVEYDKWYCSAYVSSIAYQITEEYPGASAKAMLSVSETQSGITKKIQNLMGVASVLSLFVSAICITSLLSAEIHRRKKEIGLLKALGASNFAIYAQFMGEIFIVCAVASLLAAFAGVGLSSFISSQIFGSFIDFHFMVLPLSLAFGLLICVLGGILPLRNVINLLPAEVLYGRK